MPEPQQPPAKALREPVLLDQGVEHEFFAGLRGLAAGAGSSGACDRPAEGLRQELLGPGPGRTLPDGAAYRIERYFEVLAERVQEDREPIYEWKWLLEERSADLQWVRREYMKCLSLLGFTDLIPGLVEVLEDRGERGTDRVAAARALANMGGELEVWRICRVAFEAGSGRQAAGLMQAIALHHRRRCGRHELPRGGNRHTRRVRRTTRADASVRCRPRAAPAGPGSSAWCSMSIPSRAWEGNDSRFACAHRRASVST